MNNHVWSYIFVMAAVSYLIRVLPITLIRRQIKNRFIQYQYILKKMENFQ